jgi:CBS domain-containing protein
VKIEQLMKRNVKTCRETDSLNHAAQIMWENDCGCVPVVDDDGHALGMITDRDVCMAAYTQGRPLSELQVAIAMSRDLRSCRPADTVAEAEKIMRAAQVRRLLVVDTENRVIGILSLNDVALEVNRERDAKEKRRVGTDELAATLGAICAPRGMRALATAA